jgi:hypothetical protein
MPLSYSGVFRRRKVEAIGIVPPVLRGQPAAAERTPLHDELIHELNQVFVVLRRFADAEGRLACRDALSSIQTGA